MQLDYNALQQEIDALPYGEIPVAGLSAALRAYVEARYEKGKAEIADKLKVPSKDNCGYTALLGIWYYTNKRKGLVSSIHPKTLWAAALKNHPIIKLEC